MEGVQEETSDNKEPENNAFDEPIDAENQEEFIEANDINIQVEPVEFDQEKELNFSKESNKVDEPIDEDSFGRDFQRETNKEREEEPVEMSKERFDESLSPAMDNSSEDVLNKPLMANDLFDLSDSSSNEVCVIKSDDDDSPAKKSNHSKDGTNQVFCIDETYLSSSNSAEKQIDEDKSSPPKKGVIDYGVNTESNIVRPHESEATIISLSSSMNEQDEEESENVDLLDKNLDMLDSSLVDLDDDGSNEHNVVIEDGDCTETNNLNGDIGHDLNGKSN